MNDKNHFRITDKYNFKTYIPLFDLALRTFSTLIHL